MKPPSVRVASMGKRADAVASPRRGGRPAPPRFDFDRSWLFRVILAALAIGLVFLIFKVSTMAFSGAGKRLDRLDPGREATAAPERPPARDFRPAR